MEGGRFSSDRYRLTAFRRTAMATPKANANATKYHSVGKPRIKISTLPAEKSRPINPPPNEILCIVMPGWRIGGIELSATSLACHCAAQVATRTEELVYCRAFSQVNYQPREISVC